MTQRKIIICAMLFVAFLWTLNYFLLIGMESGERGTIGDMFGAVNSIFSGLAFAGIVITIYLQMIELKLQRQELSDTRKELKRTADAQERSERTLERQAENLKQTAVINGLSTMIDLYNQELNNLAITNQGHLGKESRKKRDVYVKQLERIIQAKRGTSIRM